MDWFSWLSKTSLDPSLVYEYGLAFAHNQLERDDVPHLNHEILQSMGISVAKHRLEILKIAKKEKGRIPHPVSMILVAIKRTKASFSRRFQTWACREENALALVVPSRRCGGGGSVIARSKSSSPMLKRNERRLAAGGRSCQDRTPPLLLTFGSRMVSSSRVNSFSSPNVTDEKVVNGEDAWEEEYWSSTVEEIKWDTMFKNLKPT